MTNRSALAARLTLAFLLPLAGGCGGGGDGDGSDPPVTVTITSTAAVDGFVTSGTAFPADPSGIVGGDSIFDQGSRGFVRFALASIPVGATVVTATLTVDQAAVQGTPYATLGLVVVDHVVLGTGLDPTDYASSALTANVGILSGDATLGVKSVVVTAQVAADLAASRTDSDFRLRFTTETDGDVTNDFSQFNDAENALGTGNLPTLVVTYQP